MRGHAAANLVPVAAANRIGTETVTPCEENGGQSSSLTFYGSSFIADATGELVASAGRDTEEILYASFDLDALREVGAPGGRDGGQPLPLPLSYHDETVKLCLFLL